MGDSDVTHQNYCKDEPMKLQFLGAAGIVTGLRYLLSDDKHRLLVNCGMYQGVKSTNSVSPSAR